MSSSWSDELLRYQRSRVPARLYLPLALFLWTAGIAAGLPATLVAFPIAGVLAYTLVFQFRLWDDLNDLQRDRIDHPQRVLSQARALTPFRALGLVLFLLNTTLLAGLAATTGTWIRLLAFLLLNGAFLLWYRWRDRLSVGALAGSHVGLLKYPIFVYLLGPPSPAARTVPLLLAMALVYLCFGAYELLHDPRLQVARGTSHALAVEMTALAAVMTLMAVVLLPRGGMAALLQWTLAVAGAVALVLLFRRHKTLPAGWRYAVFLVGFSGLLTFALGSLL